MHRLPNKSAVRRIRLAALLLCVKCLLVPVTAGTLAYSLAVYDETWIRVGLALALATLLAALFQWWVGGKTHCPLCMTPVLASQNCSKHRNARAVFGSHRLRVALAVIFTNSFRCPYCHEPTELRVREHRRQYANPGS